MKWICQLVNGRMLAMISKDIFQVISTGYPYPDTEKPSAEMLRCLLAYLDIPKEKREKYDLQRLQFVLRGIEPYTDIPKEELRKLLTGEKSAIFGCYASIFFNSNDFCIYAIFNMQNLRDRYVRELFRGDLLGVTKNDVFFIMIKKDEHIEEKCKMVPRESVKEFELFDRCIKASNSLSWGTAEFEKLYSYFKLTHEESYTLRSERNLIGVFVPSFFSGLSYAFGLKNRVYSRNFDILDEVCTGLYGKNFFKDPANSRNGSDIDDEFDLYLFWNAYKLNISEEMNIKLASAIKTYLYELSLVQGCAAGFISDCSAVNDDIIVDCKEDFLPITDVDYAKGYYKRTVSFLFDNFHLFDVRVGKQKQIRFRGILGSNFTSYEKRLFQFLVVCDAVDEYKFKELYSAPCKEYKDWTVRFFSCIYESFKRRFLFGEFGTSDIKDFANNNLPLRGYISTQILYVPDLFKALRLDNFDGRQLSEDEIVFLLSFVFFLRNDKRMSEVEDGVYEVTLCEPFFNRDFGILDVIKDTNIEKGLRKALRTFVKMNLIVNSYLIKTYDKQGRYYYLEDYLFKERGIDKLSDSDFNIRISKTGIKLTLKFRR